MAGARLFDVPCDEPRQAVAGGEVRLNFEPQFRGTSGLQGTYTSGLTGDGGSSGYRWTLRRCPRVADNVIFYAHKQNKKAPFRAPFILVR